MRAAVTVFQSFGFEVERGNLRLQHSPMAGSEVNVVIGLTGDLEGQIIVGMQRKTALGVARAMIPWEISELDEVACSGIAELTNMLCGNAVSYASELGLSANVSVPSLFCGREVAVSSGGLPCLVVPLKVRRQAAEVGEIELIVLLKQ